MINTSHAVPSMPRKIASWKINALILIVTIAALSSVSIVNYLTLHEDAPGALSKNANFFTLTAEATWFTGFLACLASIIITAKQATFHEAMVKSALEMEMDALKLYLSHKRIIDQYYANKKHTD